MITIADGVFLVFLYCKLAGIISWQWWWVAAPIWIPLILKVIVDAVLGNRLWRERVKRFI